MTDADLLDQCLRAADAIETMCAAASLPWRYAVACAAADSLPADLQSRLCASLQAAGAPPPPLGPILDDAAFWAGNASPEEHRTYALICFNALSPAGKIAFLDHVLKRRAT